MNIQKNVDLKPYNSWNVGGCAEFFAQPQSISELKDVVSWSEKNSIPVTLLSGGTNVLIHDNGVSGLVIRLNELNDFSVKVSAERVSIEAEAGTPKFELFKVFSKHKLAASLFLVGLPGDVGGGVVMNAGVGENRVPREFCEIVDWVEVLRNDLTIERLKRDEIEWFYRGSRGWQPGIIIKVGLSWANEPDSEVMKGIRLANRKRVTTQPLNQPSCGSTFRNPEGAKSGALIEQCGLKGFSVGGAQVSEKHSNFIVNLGTATAQDIHQVIQHIEKTVFESTGHQLKNEVVYLGW